MLVIAHTTPLDPVRCQQLAAAGVTVFEIDVRLRAGRLVATHFIPLLPRLDVVQRHNRRFRVDGPWVRDDNLDTVVARVPGGCRVLLDCKDDTRAAADHIVAAVGDQVRDRTRFIVASKHWASLQPLADAGFETWASVATGRALRAALRGAGSASAVAVRHTLLTPERVARLSKAYGSVVAWTVADPERAIELAGMGVHGVVTDDPDVVRATSQ